MTYKDKTIIGWVVYFPSIQQQKGALDTIIMIICAKLWEVVPSVNGGAQIAGV